MFKYFIKNYTGEVIFTSPLSYNTYKEAENAGLDYLETWEQINNSFGTVIIKETVEND